MSGLLKEYLFALHINNLLSGTWLVGQELDVKGKRSDMARVEPHFQTEGASLTIPPTFLGEDFGGRYLWAPS